MSPQAPVSPDLLRRVIAPTPVGREELRDPQSGLSLPQRWLLAQLDGETALDALSRRPGSPPAERLPRDASRLVALGLAVDMGEPGPPASVFGPSTVQAELDLPLDGPADTPPSGWELPKSSPGRRPVVLAALALALVGGGATYVALQRGPAHAAAPGAPASESASPTQGARAAAGGVAPLVAAATGAPGPLTGAAGGPPAAAGGLAALTAGPSLTAPVDPATARAATAPVATTTTHTTISATTGASRGAPVVSAPAGATAQAAPVRPALAPAATTTATTTAAPSGVRETVTPLRPYTAEAPAPVPVAPPAATQSPPPAVAPTQGTPAPARAAPAGAVVAPPGTPGSAGVAPLPAATPRADAGVPATAAPAPVAPALRPSATVEPAFPREGYGLGQRAVLLQARLSIAPDGSVTQVSFAPGTGASQRPFERAARNALLQWRFPPGQGERSYQTQLRFSEE